MKRRTKQPKCLFIEDQASEGYSSEEIINEQEEEENKKQVDQMYQELLERRIKEKERLSQRLRQLMQEETLKEEEQKSEDNSCVQSNNADDPIDGPKFNDPKIWRFKFGRGINELELLSNLLVLIPKDSQIVSCFYNPNIKGSIFFETFFEQDFLYLVKNIIYGESFYIQPEQCCGLLEVKKSISLTLGQWVRFRNHKKYGTDLARVLRINRISNKITVKTIKRNQKGMKEPISFQKGKKEGEVVFQMNEESEFIYEDIDTEFKCAKLDGFELVKCNIKNIEQNITINDDELQLFFPDVQDRKILVQQAKRELMRRVDVQFKEGQQVRLIGDDDINLGMKFKILKIYDDNMIELLYKNQNSECVYIAHASEIRLAFQLYQEVKVIDGPHKGDVGIIISIKQGYVVLSNPYGTFKVPHSVLQFGHKNFQTNNDLVKFGDSELSVGCIIEQKNQSAIILTLQNEMIEVSNQKLEILRLNKVEINCKGEQFSSLDNVKILEGKYRNKIGLVKHCYNGKLYIYNQQFNNQIILENIDNCTMLVTKKNKVTQNEQKQLIGEICNIRNGQWRGYRGQIIQFKQGQVLVQLSSNNKKIGVQQNDIEFIE